MPSSSRLVGEFLVQRKVLSRDDLEKALVTEESSGIPLSKILQQEGLVDERDLVAAVAHQLGIAFWDPQTMFVPTAIDGLIPPDLARRYNALAVAIDGQSLMVAIENPADEQAITKISEATGWPVKPALATRRDIAGAISAMYGKQSSQTVTAVAEPEPPQEVHLNQLLVKVVECGASDLHLASGLPPAVRVNGSIRPLPGFDVLNASEVRRLIYGILTQRQREMFEANLDFDTSHAVPGLGRFRVNVFLQRDCVGAVLRVIPFGIVPLEQLGVPKVLREFTTLPRGLVLVTGPTGSGKSTTLASMIDIINASKPLHIMTVEDPIEFLHTHKKAVVNQREVGEDTKSFANALKHVLRQDPDVILVGEMRDLETISTALTAAETGHLVFATLHTQDAPQSIDRIIDVFPAHQQQQIRVQLATSLQGIVTQQLLPRADGTGRVVSCEVLVATPAVRNLIREGKAHQIYSSMQAGAKYGMQTMDQSLADLVRTGAISESLALERCSNQEDLRRLVHSSAAAA